MSLQRRTNIIGQINAELESPTIAYVTGDRQGMQTQVGDDQVPLFPRHLRSIGDVDQINLLLYTRGGNTNVPWTIINFIREHCDKLVVLIPYWAHSAGTLLSLGADEIIMGRYATISPIDPTVANAFNPLDPANPAARLPIAVEDVLAFLELATKNGSSANDESMALERLAQEVHPLALGNVQRSINQIRQLAAKMLGLHGPDRDDDSVKKLITSLTTEFYSHQHLIGRDEAKALGLPISPPSDDLERLLFEYYEELRVDLLLKESFDPAALLRAAQTAPAPPPPATTAGQPAAPAPVSVAQPISVPVVLERAYIETDSTADAYVTRGNVAHQVINPPQHPGMPPQAPQQAIAFEVQSETWEELK